jgi:hypothetical protein
MSQPGGREERLFTGAGAITMTTGQPTASCVTRDADLRLAKLQPGQSGQWGAGCWLTEGDPKHLFWGRRLSVLRGVERSGGAVCVCTYESVHMCDCVAM